MKKAIVIAIAAFLPVITEAAAPMVAASPANAIATPSTAPVAPSAAPASVQNSAETASPVLTGSDQLAATEARIPQLKAEAEIAELEARIRTANAATPAPAGAGAAPISSAQPPALMRIQSTSGGIDLVSVRAYKGQYTASLDINGNVIQVAQGDTVDGGWLVSTITASEVTLTRKGAAPRIVR